MKKSLFIFLGIILILFVAVGGFFYYKIFISPVYVKPLSRGYGTFNHSSNLIQEAEDRILEAETKLNEAKEKDLSQLSISDRNFIEYAIDKLEDKLEDSKKNLNKAKKYFKEESVEAYVEASLHASGSRNIANIVIDNANKILEGRTEKNWYGEAIETGTIDRIEIKECGELYYFFFEGCEHCPAQEIEINKLIIDEACFNITKIDVNKDTDLSKKYDIRAVPAFVFIDKNNCFKKSEGLKRDFELADWINYDKVECEPEIEPEIEEETRTEIKATPTPTKNDTKGEPLVNEPNESQLEDEP